MIVSLSALITRVASIALAHTGLSTQAARFQARSAYTGAGFTTSESESIMSHPVRRRIIFQLMLIGNAGFVTVMSTLILTFVLPDTLTSKLLGLLIVVVGMLLLWWAVSSPIIDRALSKLINKMLRKYTELEIQDYAAVLHLKDDYKISEKKIGADDWLSHQTLGELNLWKEGITILGVDRKDKDFFGTPSGSFEFLPEDLVTVYGKADGITSLFQRKKGYKAEVEHDKFVHEEEIHQETQEEEQKSDTNTKL